MLNPHERLLYLTELRPPQGYTLEAAIATTFSLDLTTLLMAPLSMVMWEHPDQETVLQNPLALLEALRRTADRLTVFCQRGQIAVPKAHHLLYSYLEPLVVEAQPGHPAGAFHPKTWLLRFASDSEPVLYRLLCLSRNLTADRSWDTVLVLDGQLEERQRGFWRNKPLSDFLHSLPALAVRPVPEGVRTRITQMAEEVRNVRLQVPKPFDDYLSFLPSGIPGHSRQPALNWSRRCLVVSPFVSKGWLRGLERLQSPHKNVLISRLESLDAISKRTWSRIHPSTEAYVMEEAAEHPDDAQALEERGEAAATRDDFSGLHAKLYVTEQGGGLAELRTGSANATDAAYRGANVEFMVQLKGKSSQIGIEEVLGREGDKGAWKSLLRPYRRPEVEAEEDTVAAQLEADLTEAKRAIAALALRGEVSRSEEGVYALTLLSASPSAVLPAAVEGCCFPITLQPTAAQSVALLLKRHPVTFESSLEALTAFVAFALRASQGDRSAATSFVLNLPVEGMPTDRDTAILQYAIGDRDRFLRYLRLLLAEDPAYDGQMEEPNGEPPGSRPSPTRREMGIPLLEDLVRAFSRRPDRIDRIAALVRDLSRTPEGRALIPDEFLQLWSVFEDAQRKEAS